MLQKEKREIHSAINKFNTNNHSLRFGMLVGQTECDKLKSYH